jgi:hypothetical protein
VRWVFGYGSLVVAGGGVPCSLPGHRRCWGVAMDNRVDIPGYKHFLGPDGDRPAVHVAFLDLRSDGAGTVDGAAVEVDDLAALDARERNYDRIEITGELDLPGRVFTYVGSAGGRARLAAGLADGTARISAQYAEGVEAGFAALGRLDEYRRSTDPDPCPRADLRVVFH